MSLASRVGTGVLAIGAAVAGAALTSSLAFGEESHSGSSQSEIPDRAYPTNSRGMTYGSDFGQIASPDLILAHGVDGIPGYVKREDVYGPDADEVTLDDALRYMKAGENAEARFVPLYAEDGITVIGRFVVLPTQATDPDK